MLKQYVSLYLLISFCFYPLASAATMDEALELPQSQFTEAMAQDLGMIPFQEYLAQTSDKDQKAIVLDELFHSADLVIVINKGVRSDKNPKGQTLKVFRDGQLVKEYDVSTGTEKSKVTTSGREYIATTPTGVYRPTRAYREYQSATFLGAPMTYAVFFQGGIAIHSTTKNNYANLGNRASGGCVRMKLEEAQALNEAILETGEPNRNLRNESFVEGGTMLKRYLYLNREKLASVERLTGVLDFDNLVWTYNTLIYVHE